MVRITLCLRDSALTFGWSIEETQVSITNILHRRLRGTSDSDPVPLADMQPMLGDPSRIGASRSTPSSERRPTSIHTTYETPGVSTTNLTSQTSIPEGIPQQPPGSHSVEEDNSILPFSGPRRADTEMAMPRNGQSSAINWEDASRLQKRHTEPTSR